MSSFVVDSSALMAILWDEPGAENLPPEEELRERALMSTVNMCEVHGKLVLDGINPDEAWDGILGMIHKSIELNEEQAKLAGNLCLQTRKLGLSLGDRACVALALTLNAPIYTADRQWSKLKLGIPIHVIR